MGGWHSAPQESTSDEQLLDCSPIIDGELYLGSRQPLQLPSALAKLNIGHILSITNLDIDLDRKAHTFVHKQLRVLDAPGTSLLPHFGELHAFIDEARSRNSAVFVHCEAGMSRSATVVISYLLTQPGYETLEEAWRHVKRCRPQICPNSGFLAQIAQFYLQRVPSVSVCSFDDGTLSLGRTDSVAGALALYGSDESAIFSKSPFVSISDTDDVEVLDNELDEDSAREALDRGVVMPRRPSRLVLTSRGSSKTPREQQYECVANFFQIAYPYLRRHSCEQISAAIKECHGDISRALTLLATDMSRFNTVGEHA